MKFKTTREETLSVRSVIESRNLPIADFFVFAIFSVRILSISNYSPFIYARVIITSSIGQSS